MTTETQSRNEAAKAAIDQIQIRLNQAPAQMLHTVQIYSVWVIADTQLTTKFPGIDNDIPSLTTATESSKSGF